MIVNQPIEHGTVIGTIGGTALAVSGITSTDIEKTVLLATLGATVSVLVSLFLKWLVQKVKSL